MEIPGSLATTTASASGTSAFVSTSLPSLPSCSIVSKETSTVTTKETVKIDPVFQKQQDVGSITSTGNANISFSFVKAFENAKAKPEVLQEKSGHSDPDKPKRDTKDASKNMQSPFAFVKTFNQPKEARSTTRSNDKSSSPLKFYSDSKPKSSSHERSHSGKLSPTSRRRHSKGSLFSKALADVNLVQPKTRKQELRRRSSSVIEEHILLNPSEIQHLTTVVCTDVPDDINRKELLLDHFTKFGSIIRTRCNLRKQRAVIQFKDHNSAVAAKQRGTKINGQTVQIFWSQKASERQSPKDTSFSSEVDEELQAMAGSIEEPHLLPRPEETKHSNNSKVTPHSSKLPKTSIKRKTENLSQVSVPKKVDTSAPKESTTVDASEESLTALLSYPASTVTEKFSVLDARDKLMRLRQQKQSDIKSATAISGICPDMCPEKERYSRSFKSGLSIFEIKKVNNCQIPDHHSMIKEYSRSSADQEEPLPHELRPTFTLVITMNHLLCNVMNTLDEGSASTGDWYDFIWNRTRAIRKDITQQHMCDLTSVELVEKCARFHIHCAAALCEEDMAVFDVKINNENLTKCMQTLKHFYHDLGVKGINCPNEAEFRCYDVLINLNEGDILRQIQKLHPRIRKSPEVIFAVKTFSALNSNNYVQFFRLAIQASYLNSCILHRYFTQVRSKAFTVILKAYCLPNHSEQYPLDDLVRILSFEDEKEAEMFCNWLGLETNEKYVILNRSMLNAPSGLPQNLRSKTLVESKKQCSLGEVVNAGPLPPNPLLMYEPHSSFDSEGFLKKEAYDASDQYNKVLRQQNYSCGDCFDLQKSFDTSHDDSSLIDQQEVPESADETDSFEIQSRSIESQYSDDAMKDVVTDLVEQVIDSELRQISSEYVGFLQTTQSIGKTFLEDFTREFLREISQEVISEENYLVEKAKKEAEERRIIYLMKENAIAKIAEEMIEEVIAEELSTESRNILNSFIEERINRVSAVVTDVLLDELLNEELIHLANEVLDYEVKLYEEKLNMVKQHVRRLMLAKYFQRWQKFHIQKRQLERARQLFPPCPPLFSKLENSNVKRKRKSSLEIPFSPYHKVSKILDAKLCTNLLEEEVSWLPLQLEKIVKSCFKDRCNKSHQNCFCWTLTIAYPLADPISMEEIRQWLCMKFSGKPTSVQGNLENNFMSTLLTKEIIMNDTKKLVLRVNTTCTPLEHWDRKQLSDKLRSTSSLLVVLPMFFSPEETFKKMQSQLQFLLRAHKSLVPACFLAFATHKYREYDAVAWSEKMNLLLQSSFQSPVNLISVKNVNHAKDSQKLEEAVQWLTVNTTPFPDVVSKSIKLYLQEGLSTFVFTPVYENLSDLRQIGCYQQDPDAIIGLYNFVLRHLANVAKSTSLSGILQFFEHGTNCNWKEESEKLEEIILVLNLPYVEEVLGTTAAETPDDIYTYVLNVAQQKSCDLNIVFCRIKELFERSKSLTHARKISVVSWADIVCALVNHLLESVVLTKEVADKEMIVYFFENEYWRFSFPENWTHFVQQAATLSLELSSDSNSDQENVSDLEFETTQNINSLWKPRPSKLSSLTGLEAEALDTYSTFQKEAMEEHEKSLNFSALLSKVLEEGKSVISETSSIHRSIENPELQSTIKDAIENENKTYIDTFLHSQSESLESKLMLLKSKLNKCKAENKHFNVKLQGLMNEN